MAARKHWNRFWSGVAAVGVCKCVVFLNISPYGRCNFLITSHLIIKIYFFFIFIWWVKGDLRPFQETRNLSTASLLMCLSKVSLEQLHTRLSSLFQEKFGLFGSDRTNILLLKYVQHHYPAALLTLWKRVGIQSSSSSRDELVSSASFLGCSGLTTSLASYWEIPTTRVWCVSPGYAAQKLSESQWEREGLKPHRSRPRLPDHPQQGASGAMSSPNAPKHTPASGIPSVSLERRRKAWWRSSTRFTWMAWAEVDFGNMLLTIRAWLTRPLPLWNHIPESLPKPLNLLVKSPFSLMWNGDGAASGVDMTTLLPEREGGSCSQWELNSWIYDVHLWMIKKPQQKISQAGEGQ